MKRPDFSKIHEDTEAMKKSFKLGLKELEEVLDRKKDPTDLTRIASNTVSNYVKAKAAEIHDKALEVIMARKDIKLLE